MVTPIGEFQADHQENPLIIYDYRGIFLKKDFQAYSHKTLLVIYNTTIFYYISIDLVSFNRRLYLCHHFIC